MKHILTRTEEAARQSADLQSRAMADAARVAFGADLGATLQRLQSLQRATGTALGAVVDPCGSRGDGIGGHLDAGDHAVGSVNAHAHARATLV